MAGATCHEACDMLESECPRAAAALGDAEPDALAYPDFPVSHWGKLKTNNVQERTNAVQVFPSEASLERLVGAVLLERAREWDQRRHMSGGRMGDLCDRPMPEPTTEECARRALEASLELAEGLRAAWDGHQTSDAGKGAYTNIPDAAASMVTVKSGSVTLARAMWRYSGA